MRSGRLGAYGRWDRALVREENGFMSLVHSFEHACRHLGVSVLLLDSVKGLFLSGTWDTCGAVIGIDCSFQEGRDVLVDSRLSGKQHSWMGWDGMGCVVQMGSMHACMHGGTEGWREGRPFSLLYRLLCIYWNHTFTQSRPSWYVYLCERAYWNRDFLSSKLW